MVKTKRPQTFHLFPRLPTELRLQIWNQAILSSRRMVNLYAILHSSSPFHYSNPSFTSVNQESRYAALKHYTWLIEFPEIWVDAISGKTIENLPPPSASSEAGLMKGLDSRSGYFFNFTSDIFFYKEHEGILKWKANSTGFSLHRTRFPSPDGLAAARIESVCIRFSDLYTFAVYGDPDGLFAIINWHKEPRLQCPKYAYLWLKENKFKAMKELIVLPEEKERPKRGMRVEDMELRYRDEWLRRCEKHDTWHCEWCYYEGGFWRCLSWYQ